MTAVNSNGSQRQSKVESRRSQTATAIPDVRFQVSDANATASIGEAEAEAKSIDGSNVAKIKIAQSNAERQVKEAEALRIATAAEKIQKAKALEEAYLAEKEAEEARAAREMATRQADTIVQAQIDKEKLVIDAEAEAEQIRALAKGQADAIYLKKEAEAKGIYETAGDFIQRAAGVGRELDTTTLEEAALGDITSQKRIRRAEAEIAARSGLQLGAAKKGDEVTGLIED